VVDGLQMPVESLRLGQTLDARAADHLLARRGARAAELARGARAVRLSHVPRLARQRRLPGEVTRAGKDGPRSAPGLTGRSRAATPA
jgi:hypothetical protein